MNTLFGYATTCQKHVTNRGMALRGLLPLQGRPDELVCLVRPAAGTILTGAILACTLGSVDAQAAVLPMISVASGKCMSPYNGSPARGTAVVQTACNNASAQQWSFQAVGTAFRLIAVKGGKCIALGALSDTEGTPAVMSKCDALADFDFRPLGRGYEMVAQSTGKCLGTEGGTLQEGARIVQQTCNRSAFQTWATSAGTAAPSTWSALKQLGLVPVAAAHLSNGKLMLWSSRDPMNYGGDYGRTYTSLLEPTTLTATDTLVSYTSHDMFCPGTANLPDGRIHVSGGGSSQKTSLYNPTSNVWTVGAPLNIARGYQGSVTLSNGGVMTYGGSWSGGVGGKTAEVWTEAAGWRVVPNLPDSVLFTGDAAGVYRSDNHGWFFATGAGRVFHAGPSRTMHWIDTAGDGAVTSAGVRADGDAMNGNAVMYDVGRILMVGGALSYEGTPATNKASLIDIRNGVTVRSVAPMAYTRATHNSVVLPNGQVVVIGGQAVPRLFNEDLAVLTPEVWDPRTESFTALAPIAVPRVYHSVALLLPDGRVMSAGGGLCGACSVNRNNLQVLVPPYLLNPDGTSALQPQIVKVASQASLGQTLRVKTDSAVSSFALVRMSSVTHSVNNEQRRVPLAFQSLSATSYQVNLALDAGVVVPGYWMLFALTPNGVPSKAAIIRIG